MSIQVTNVKQFVKRLNQISKNKANASVAVSFATTYALRVHEDLTMGHRVGQAKFLEAPARRNANQYTQMVIDEIRKGKSFAQALMIAGRVLQRDAQALTPVDTGLLRSSAKTELENMGFN